MKFQLFSVFLFVVLSYALHAQKSVFKDVSIYEAVVYFDFGSHDLRTETDSILMALANKYRNQQNIKVRITAHTDSIGSLQNNLALSQRRAEAVKRSLSEKGIPQDSLYLQYLGEKNPVESNRTDEGRQLNRRTTIELIKTLKIVPVEGNIKDMETGKGIEAEVMVHSKYTRDSTWSDTSGYFVATAPEGEVTAVDVLAKGYFLKSTMLRILPSRMAPLQIDLSPSLPGTKADIQNLYFVGNQAILLERSKPVLPGVLKFMQVNWHLKIEIAGHINQPSSPPVPKNDSGYKLSVDRARLVYDYLIDNGIPKDRIRYVGYGNWEMRFPKAKSEEEQSQNRRVEIRILE